MLFQFHFFIILLLGGYLVYLFLIHSKKLAGICFIAICIGAVFATVHDSNNRTTISPQETSFVGIVHSTPVVDGDSLQFFFLIDNEKLQVSYVLETEKEKEQLKFLKVGAYVKIYGTLEEPPESRNNHQFDYKEYLYKQHIHYILKGNKIIATNHTSNHPYYTLLRFRQDQLQYIQAHFPEETIPFVESLIFGSRNQFSPDVQEWYQKLGIVHLLAISGSHISLIIGAGYYLLLRVGLTKEKATFVLLFLIPVYMILAGGSASVIRASSVAIIVLLAFFTESKILAVDILSVVFILMLFINPYFLSEAGFLLSFTTSFTLIVSSSYLSSFPSGFMSIIVTIVAQLSSLPIVLFYYYEISLYSVLLNALFVPFILFLILPLCIVSLLLHILFPPVGMIVIYILEQLIIFSNNVLSFFAELPVATIIFGKPSYLWILGYYLTLIVFYIRIERRKSIKLLSFGLLALLIFQWADTDPSIKVTFIDVGQGDCMLIQLAKEVYIVDTGGTIAFPKQSWQQKKKEYDVGRDVVVSYLKSQGISNIDKLILTHGDTDHIGGAVAILKEIKVKEVVVGKKSEHTSLEERVMKEARKQGAKITTVTAGDSWIADNHKFSILSPYGDEQEENDRSIVLYTVIGEYRWLFTGDLEEGGEQRLMANYPDLETDVLKLGHHGSKTSSTEAFLEKINPKIAVISAGKNNRYNHPHQEVMERLQQIFVLRTDKQGMITYQYLRGQGTFHVHIPYDE